MTETQTRDILKQGVVIPAMPLALTDDREFDPAYQRALLRYYMDAGAGGVAAGVHTTQFEIRDDPRLFETVLSLVSEEIDRFNATAERPVIKVGGILGRTEQALGEAELLSRYGYDCGLLSLTAFRDESIDTIIDHCEKVSEEIPIIGFYLQTAVGGIHLPYEFWKRFVRIDRVLAIKVAPFDRYRTIDVVRAVAESDRRDQVALYTGNDDSIVFDLLSTYRFSVNGGEVEVGFVGGLLGQWAVWTKAAVELLERIHSIKKSGDPPPNDLLHYAHQLTDANAALFDAQNGFAGSIAGIHEVLRRNGLLRGIQTLTDREVLSPGQTEEISRVINAYPHLTDNNFVAAGRERWFAPIK